LIKTGYLNEASFPLVIKPAVENVILPTWLETNREYIASELSKHGAVLFRGFQVPTPDDFSACAVSFSGELAEYNERAAPRMQVRERVYTSTEFPADQHIPMHHEMSYSHNSPLWIWFYCDRCAETGGRTPIASDRKVLSEIATEIREEFTRRQVMYIRNFGEGVDLPWQDAFQTSDRGEVEHYCQRAGMTYQWRGGDRLHTRQVRPAMARHPETGEPLWFNHAHMFHTSNLPPDVVESLLGEFAPEDLPRNCFFGDGGPIADELLDCVRLTYMRHAVGFDWQERDVLLLDNFVSTHGREPFTGPRRTLVSMARMIPVEAY
jgi:alpha-ketoglutarate-dependent taurine dioxygenase